MYQLLNHKITWTVRRSCKESNTRG